MAVQTPKVALITGGAGGLGLGVAQDLAARGGWQIHILDVKEDEGKKAAGALPDTTFHKVDLTDYNELSAAFKAVYVAGGDRLDFVHANAGLVEKSILREPKSDSVEPPPQPDYSSIEVNLKGAIDTVHLARHFMLRSPEKGSIVMTASCASIWPTYMLPLYTASKFGVLGFVRAVAGHFKDVDGIRINVVCPGAMRTPLMPNASAFTDDLFTPLELVAEVVRKLASGEEIVDSRGVRVPADKCYGQAVVACGKQFYVHEEPEYCDDVMARTIMVTKGMS